MPDKKYFSNSDIPLILFFNDSINTLNTIGNTSKTTNITSSTTTVTSYTLRNTSSTVSEALGRLRPRSSLQVYPELSDVSQACMPLSSFFTCSSDNTIRLWHADPPTGHRNLYSNVRPATPQVWQEVLFLFVLHGFLFVFQDLLRILYVGENTQHLQAEGESADGKAGIRVLGISPDGRHLAAGDRCGNLQ